MNLAKVLENISLTTEQMTELFGVTNMTIYRWRKSGMPYTKKGKHIRYNLEEVKKWAEETGQRVKYVRE